MWDDHMYCPACDRHSLECYCRDFEWFSSVEEMIDEFPPTGPCLNHNMHGEPVPLSALLERL